MKLERSKLESSDRCWKVRTEVGKLGLKLESLTAVGKFWLTFGPDFPTSIFPISFRTFQHKTFQLLVLSNCPFQLHVSPKNEPNESSPVWGTLYDRFTPRFPVKILVIIGLLFCFFGNFLYVIQRKRYF